MLEIIANVSDDEQILRLNDPAQTQRKFRAPMPPDSATTRSRVIETDPHAEGEPGWPPWTEVRTNASPG